MSFEINLHFPDVDYTVKMPAVPRKGETIEWEAADERASVWTVTAVEYTAYPDQEGSINLTLDPPDQY
ncbi:hypothetical protein ACFCY8_11225 [Streptomyces noursei]|uniref:hypothetical protein n=1 Tax=Streptomyces noursei TaxID=1971 RepID=UPI0035D9E74D